MGARSELAEVMIWIEEYGDARRLLDLDVDAARGNGDISLLVYALPLRAQLEIRLGRLPAAYADALEGVELAETMGQPFNTAEALVVLAHVEALSGRDCAVHAKQAMALAPHNLAVETGALVTRSAWRNWPPAGPRRRWTSWAGRTRSCAPVAWWSRRRCRWPATWRRRWRSPAVARRRPRPWDGWRRASPDRPGGSGRGRRARPGAAGRRRGRV